MEGEEKTGASVTETQPQAAEEPQPIPWKFTPLLYFMQAIPVTLVQEVSTIVFKSLGIENSTIIFWVSLIALPWSLQMLLGPFVDLNGSKRSWVLLGQAAIALGLIGTAFALQMPNPFHITVAILGVTAIFSALCNIATDGFYILALNKQKQAQYVGLNSTFYRMGRLFCTGLLVYFAGTMMKIPNVDVQTFGGQIAFKQGDQTIVRNQAVLTVSDNKLKAVEGSVLTDPQIDVPPMTEKIIVMPDGTVMAKPFGQNAKSIGSLKLLAEPGQAVKLEAKAKDGQPLPPAMAWGIVMGLCTVVYVLGRLILPVTLPRPRADIVKPFNASATSTTIVNTLLVIGLFLAVVIGLGNVIKLFGHWMSTLTSRLPIVGDIAGWKLSPEALQAEPMWLLGCLVASAVGTFLVRKQLRGTEMGEAFTSFVRQQGFLAILFFILFYRFSEAMVGRVTPLFYQDPTDKGGLGITVDQLGIVNGVMGVVGIILGGIVGGLVVSKIGLRKAFVPLALAMHVPNALYLWASIARPQLPADPSTAQIVFSPVSGIAFVDQFGYGFGFAAYMVYLMWVAQRGKFKTSHYAIGTGMGAMLIAAAGIFSGVIQKNYGYTNFYITVLFCGIPGMLSLLFIPLDEKEGRDIEVQEIGD